MANPKDPALATMVNKLWAATISVDADPALTVNRIPEANAQEVENLSRTLHSTETAAPLPVPALGSTAATIVEPSVFANQPPQPTLFGGSALPPSAVPAAHSSAEGVAGRDFFAMSTQLGKGGMGVVFAAKQESLAREVAVKTLRGEDEVTDSRKAAFLREALTTAALTHPNIVPVHLFGRDHQGRLFLVMKRVDGKAWNTLLREASADPKSFDLARQLEILLKVCDAVGFAHARQIVHRDLKPENIIVGDFGEATVMDWGLAVDISAKGTAGVGTLRGKASVAGSPAYMAPEMALAQMERISPATDIYLLGSILHEIVTGKPPHSGRTIFEVLEHAAMGKIDPIVPRPGMPKEVRELERILRKALAAEPANRFGTVAEFQSDLRAFMAGQGDRVESEELAKDAREALAALSKDSEKLWTAISLYTRCAEILATAQRALSLWGHNPRAARVRQEALALYAQLATRGKDWGLAESLFRDLRLSGSGGAALAQPIEQSMREARAAWQRRQSFFIRAYRLAAIMFFAALGMGLYFYWKLSELRITQEVEAEQRLQQAQEEEDAAPAKLPSKPRVVSKPESKEPKNLKPERENAEAQPAGIKLPAPGSQPENIPPNPTPVPAPPLVKAGFGALAAPPWWIPKAGAEPGNDPAQAMPLLGLRLGTDGQWALWDREGRAWLRRAGEPAPSAEAQLFPEAQLMPVCCVQWLDARTLAVGSERGEIRIGDSPGHPWNTVLRCGSPIRAIASLKKDGFHLLAAAVGESLWLLSTKGGEPRKEAAEAPILDVAYLPNGGLLVATRKHVEVWPPEGQHMKFELGAALSRAAIARQGQRMVLQPADKPKRVLVFSMQTRQAMAADFAQGQVTCLAISPDGQYVAAGSSQGELMLWRDLHWRCLSDPQKPPPEVSGVEISSNGAIVYSLDPAGGVHAWKTGN